MDGKKRPRGLKKSIAGGSKRPKLEKKDDEVATPVPPTDEAMAIALEGVEEGDEVAELQSMYDTALSKQDIGDVEGATMLFRGCVHECDKLLRQRDGVLPPSADPSDAAAPSTTATELTPDFYLVYGNSLYRLGLLAANEEEATNDTLLGYLDAAVERLESGLEHAREREMPEENLWQLHASLGRVLMHKASELLRGAAHAKIASKSAIAVADSAGRHLDAGMLGAKKVGVSDLNAELLDVGAVVQRHADLYDDLEGREKWNHYAVKRFEEVLGADPSNVDALVGLGSCSLSVANLHLERADDDGNEDKVCITTHLERALDYLRRAEKIASANDVVHVSLLCLMGETLINLGNLNENDDEDGSADGEPADDSVANGFYTQAFECFRKVQSADSDALPPQFAEFVEEWAKDL
ncbi:inhibitor of Brome mosaic virus [Borealophlyctis nickersoniae]|nr:inhibitor of Brome mosaic virus [Borealophlyctis nickersoniae]